MGKKTNRTGWARRAWREFDGYVWNAGDSHAAQGLVDKWVEEAFSNLRDKLWQIPPSTPERGKILDKDELLKTIEFIGDTLATSLGKSPYACKGLFILCIEAELGNDGLYLVRKDDVGKAIHGSLKDRLALLNIADVEHIITDLASRVASHLT
jgi:hypothetical protein